MSTKLYMFIAFGNKFLQSFTEVKSTVILYGCPFAPCESFVYIKNLYFWKKNFN